MKHHVERTSPKGPGMPFIGTCILCGKTGLKAAAALEDCENFRNLTSEEAIVEVLGCTCNNALDSCPIHGLGPEGREDKGA